MGISICLIVCLPADSPLWSRCERLESHPSGWQSYTMIVIQMALLIIWICIVIFLLLLRDEWQNTTGPAPSFKTCQFLAARTPDQSGTYCWFQMSRGVLKGEPEVNCLDMPEPIKCGQCCFIFIKNTCVSNRRHQSQTLFICPEVLYIINLFFLGWAIFKILEYL